MIAKTIIHQTLGLGVLLTEAHYIDSTRPGWGDQSEALGYGSIPVDQLHTWFVKREQDDGDDVWAFYPIVAGTVITHSGGGSWMFDDWESFEGGRPDGFPTPEQLASNAIECEHYQFGAGVLLRGCTNEETDMATDLLFLIHVSDGYQTHRLETTTLCRHPQEGSCWSSDYTPEGAVDPYFAGALPAGLNLPVVPTPLWQDPAVEPATVPPPATPPPGPTARVVIRRDAGLCVLIEGVNYVSATRPDYTGALGAWLGRPLDSGELRCWPFHNGNPICSTSGNFPDGGSWTRRLHTHVEQMPELPDLTAQVLLAEHYELGLGYLVRNVNHSHPLWFVAAPRYEGHRCYAVAATRLLEDFSIQGRDSYMGEYYVGDWGTVRDIFVGRCVTALRDLSWPPVPVASTPAPAPLQTRLGNTLFQMLRSNNPLFRGAFRARFNKVVPDLTGEELDAWLLAASEAPAAPVAEPTRAAAPREPEPELEIGFNRSETVIETRRHRVENSGSGTISISAARIRRLLEDHDGDLDSAADELEEIAQSDAEDEELDLDQDSEEEIATDDWTTNESHTSLSGNIRRLLAQFIEENNLMPEAAEAEAD